MDNLRRPNDRRKNISALDGVVPTARRGGRYGERDVRASIRQAPKTGAGRLDDFKRRDGFQSSSKQIATPRAAQVGRRPMTQQPPKPDMSVLNLQLQPASRRRRGRARKSRSWKRTLLKTALVLIVTGLLAGGFLFGKGYFKVRHIFKGGTEGAAALQNNVDPTKLKGEGDGRVNILLIGKGGPGHEGPDLTDTLVIASVDPIQKTAALLSVPRDLYVKPAGLNYMKINSVYATAKGGVLNGKKIPNQAEKAEEAGITALETVLEKNIGIPVHYYVMVDFEGFRKAIDTVGGVTVDVKTQLYDPTVAWENNWNPLIAPVGVQTMNGKKALLYARSRNGSVRGDFDRAQRQREILLAFKDKVLSAGTYSNPLKISQLIDAFGDHVSTNLSIGEMMRLYEIGKSIDGTKVASVGLADPPNNYVKTDFIDNQSVVIPRAGITDYSEIQNYVRNALKDGFLINENATIAVYNGTTVPGLAAKKATELKSYGYTVGTIADAPTKSYTKTVLVDMRNGAKRYTKSYLEKRLGVTATTTIPDVNIKPGEADFVIILGSNESTNSQN